MFEKVFLYTRVFAFVYGPINWKPSSKADSEAENATFSFSGKKRLRGYFKHFFHSICNAVS